MSIKILYDSNDKTASRIALELEKYAKEKGLDVEMIKSSNVSDTRLLIKSLWGEAIGFIDGIELINEISVSTVFKKLY